MKTTQLLSLFIAATLPLASLRAADGWINLFNGKNLDGWEQHGGTAKYTVVDGVIVGESVPDTGNSFLCPKESFGDFELELEYQVDAALNSGVMFRSEVFPDARTIQVNGKDIKLPADRMHGYQCEIDMDTKRNRMWTAGVYDEARRNWLYPGPLGGNGDQFTEQGRKISKPGEWNRLRLLCVGPAIKIWLNGEPRADFSDAMTPRGRIGLQVHGVGKDKTKVGLQAKFRNVRIREIKGEAKSAATTDAKQTSNTLSEAEKAAGWKLLWDGKTSEGWRSAKAETFPTKGWAIADGELTVLASNGGESTAGGDIITTERYSQFDLSVDFKITEGANSGIKYYTQPSLSPIDKVTGKPVAVGSAIGVEFQILDDVRHKDAKMGRDGNRTIGSLYDLLAAAADKQPNPIGEWNTALIKIKGQHVEHWLNGKKVLEYERASQAFRDLVAISKYKKMTGFGEWPDGHILLQDHGDKVSFRNIKILDRSPR